jgi:hypothetical protein
MSSVWGFFSVFRVFRVFKRLRELECGLRSEVGLRSSQDLAIVEGVMRREEYIVSRFVACPHCGSVLDGENPGTSRPFVTKDGGRLCCWSCRPFMPKLLVKVSYRAEPIRKREK